MFVEKIESKGLAHYSYIIGDARQAAVIDPRRDCEIYIEQAAARGAAITHIFETHRNEDLVSGAKTLSEMTGAPVWHGPNADGDVQYARTAREGEKFTFAGVRLEVIETPGHTFDSISLAIYDETTGGEAVGVFTGDALFVGDVGRTDFYPDEAERVAGLLFDSLQKILTLGDQAVVYPAHGAGSVCGAGMADREFSTIGYERAHNAKLALDQTAFIGAKVAERHYRPPYFRLMERLNLEGGPPATRVFSPRPLSLRQMQEEGAAWIVDTRATPAFLGAHYPNALSLPLDAMASFAGWFLNEQDEFILSCADAAEAREAVKRLSRMGIDGVVGVAPSIAAAAAAGRDFAAMPVVDVHAVKRRLEEASGGWSLLDVRSRDEVAEFSIEGSRSIYVGELPDRIGELDPSQPITAMCGSGVRAAIAASFLRARGFGQVDVFLGSAGAWRATMS